MISHGIRGHSDLLLCVEIWRFQIGCSLIIALVIKNTFQRGFHFNNSVEDWLFIVFFYLLKKIHFTAGQHAKTKRKNTSTYTMQKVVLKVKVLRAKSQR